MIQHRGFSATPKGFELLEWYEPEHWYPEGYGLIENAHTLFVSDMFWWQTIAIDWMQIHVWIHRINVAPRSQGKNRRVAEICYKIAQN